MTSNSDTSRPSRSNSTFRPEEELLLCCSRVHLDPDTRQRLDELLAGPLDWPYLLKIARGHWVTSLVYWHLRSVDASLVPEAILQELSDQFHFNARRSLQLVGALRYVLQVLEQEGIAALSFKGPLLAANLYGNLALRECCDIDILVTKQQVMRAKTVLLSNGYQLRNTLTAAQEAARLDSRCEVVLQDQKGHVAIDLHWDVVPSFFCPGLAAENLLARRVTEHLGHLTIPSLAPEDVFLVLCVHGGKHAWSQLKWICDVAVMLQSGSDLRWPFILERAVHLGIERLVLIAVHIANDLLQAPIPKEVADRLGADKKAQRLAGDLAEKFFTHRTLAGTFTEQTVFCVKARERWSDKFRHALWIALVPTEEDMGVFHLPGALRPAGLVLRPLRLIGRYGVPWLTRRLAIKQ